MLRQVLMPLIAAALLATAPAAAQESSARYTPKSAAATVAGVMASCGCN